MPAVISTVGIILAPLLTKTDHVNEDNTFKYEATVSYTKINTNKFEIYIEEDERPLYMKMDKSGDRITYFDFD